MHRRCQRYGVLRGTRAIAAMATAGENRIQKIVAIGSHVIIPPCGRCREFISQIHDENIETLVMVSETEFATIRQLLPYHP